MDDLFVSDRPLIGMLHFSAEERSRFPPLRLRALLAEAVLQGARFCRFDVSGCDVEAGVIEADVWLDTGFHKRTIARPDVAVIAAKPILTRHIDVRNWIRERCPTIEDLGPNKASLRDLLQGTPFQRYTLPQRVFQSDEDVYKTILSWLRSNGSSVIKPADGNRGKGVQFVLKQKRYWTHRVDRDSWTGSMQDVTKRAAEAIAGRARYRPYLMQPYVRSVAADGRAFYLRIDVHKDGAGSWRIIKRGARLGEIGFSVGNPTNAGYSGDIDAALSYRERRCGPDIAAEADALALNLARFLDEDPAIHVKELGVDMVLDENDALWLIEANMQPQSSGHNLERANVHIDYCLAAARGSLRMKPFNSSTSKEEP